MLCSYLPCYITHYSKKQNILHITTRWLHSLYAWIFNVHTAQNLTQFQCVLEKIWKNQICEMNCWWFWKGQQAKYNYLFHTALSTGLEKFSHMYSVFNKVHPKMPIRLWTFWSWSQCRYFYGTLSSIVRNISRDHLRDKEKQIFDLIYHLSNDFCQMFAGIEIGNIARYPKETR